MSISVQTRAMDSHLWTGRAEPFESARARYWYQVAAPYSAQAVGLVGFACDQGVRRNQGRVGAKDAPPMIRQAFAKLPITAAIQQRYDNDNALAQLLGDAGDIHCLDEDTLSDDVLETAQQQYADTMTQVLNQGGLAVGLGGGHAIAYGSFLGLWQHLTVNNNKDSNENYANTNNDQLPRIGILNFDAHLDLRQAPMATSGTPFRQISEHLNAHGQPFHYCCIGVSRFSNTAALFDRAEDLQVTIISDEACAEQPWTKIAAQIDAFMAEIDVLYMTIDMDCFPAAIVPGVSAPAAYGIALPFVERCIQHLFATGKVKVADIAEINPAFDIDQRSAKVAARLLALITEQQLLHSS